MDPVRGEAHKENFFRVLRFGLCCTTTFSGFDAPREAMRLMVLALQSICPEKAPISVSFRAACDIERPALHVLQQLSFREKDASCVFKDLRARLGPEACKYLAKLRPPKDAGVRVRREAFCRMEKYLAAHSSQLFSVDARAPCVVHGQQCLCRTRPQGPMPLTLNIAGSICQGWSMAGKRAGFGHDSEELHAIWRQERVEEAKLGLEHGFSTNAPSGTLTKRSSGNRLQTPTGARPS